MPGDMVGLILLSASFLLQQNFQFSNDDLSHFLQ
jgi:hypothetical protein